VRRVVTDDILTDFVEATFAQIKPAQREELSASLKTGADHTINTVFKRVMKESLVMDLGRPAGHARDRHQDPAEWLSQMSKYRTDDVFPLIEQDVLLLGGGEDHLVPLHQFHDQIRSLTHPRSLTARLFTRQEQAHEHVQTGDLGLQFRSSETG